MQLLQYSSIQSNEIEVLNEEYQTNKYILARIKNKLVVHLNHINVFQIVISQFIHVPITVSLVIQVRFK